MASDNEKKVSVTTHLTLGTMSWLGGAFYVGHQPGMGFWDGVVWLWYVGRYIAAHFTMLSY